MSRLYLIRHGEAVSNVEPILGGMRGDTGLTSRGIHQAERLRDRLMATGEIVPDVFLSSTLPRARQTAQIIAPAFDAPIVLDDELQELRLGEADGLHVGEFLQRYGRPDFDKDPARPVAPDGESWTMFLRRASSVLERLVQEHADRCIVAVCHGGIIDASFLSFFNMQPPARSPILFHTRNASLTLWEHEPVGEMPRWRLHFYNDAAHLAGLSQARPMDWREADELYESESGRLSVPVPSEDGASHG